MAVFKANFLAGLLVGAAVAVALPFAGAEVFATLSDSAQAAAPPPAVHQVVNRAGKADRLHPTHNASSPVKPAKIPEGCDPAFSPLSKGAASNFSGRCLA